jgi:tetratricopeptide (TPR) repeat protein
VPVVSEFVYVDVNLGRKVDTTFKYIVVDRNYSTERQRSGPTSHEPRKMAPKRKLDGSAATNSSLVQLFSQMKLAASQSDYSKILDISNEILKSSPTNSAAAKQKVIALIRIDKYKEVLAFLDKSSFLDDKDVALERGYALYKLGKGDEARQALEKGSGRAVMHVKAQNVRAFIV